MRRSAVFMLLPIVCYFPFLSLIARSNVEVWAEKPFWQWSMSEAVQILNSSPWARQETFTTVVGGVGSGRSGEKEIYNRFYVRFLSAKPVREAYARIQQIRNGYDKLGEEEKQRFNELIEPILEMEVDRWIVVSVSFRSNDPNQESQVRRYFQSETGETLKDKAFLSTKLFSQVEIAAYFPPREESVGAKFVFPREINGTPLITERSNSIAFELLDVPSARPSLRSTFPIKRMVVDGKLVF